MATFVLTYNPAKWTWDSKEFARQVKQTAEGRMVPSQWSTGGRIRGIEAGDQAILLLQGTGPRGIIGRGVFTDGVHQGPHWDGKAGLANYAPMNWTMLLPVEDRIPTEDLLVAVPDAPWNNMQASGVKLTDAAEADLNKLLGVGGGRKGTERGGQRRQQDAVRRVMVENYAQTLLEDHYRSRGWTVVDTRRGNPYDAVAAKGRRRLYLEAKGTESDGRSVLVTIGEVEFARRRPGKCVLGVVSGIRFTKAGDVDNSSGTLVLYEWDPDAGKLEPKQFSWTPPVL